MVLYKFTLKCVPYLFKDVWKLQSSPEDMTWFVLSLLNIDYFTVVCIKFIVNVYFCDW